MTKQIPKCVPVKTIRNAVFYHCFAMCALVYVSMIGGCALTNEIVHNRYVGDKDTMIYHKERCDQVKKIQPLKVTAFPYNSAARYEGYRPCDKCNPDK